MEGVPYIFQPLSLRSVLKFRDLEKHSFTPAEIIWLCKEMEHSNPFWEYHRVSSITISKRYNINMEGLKLWVADYSKNYDCFSQNEPCIQPLMDGISYRKITNLFNANETSTLDLITIMSHEFIQTKKRRAIKSSRKLTIAKAPR